MEIKELSEVLKGAVEGDLIFDHHHNELRLYGPNSTRGETMVSTMSKQALEMMLPLTALEEALQNKLAQCVEIEDVAEGIMVLVV